MLTKNKKDAPGKQKLIVMAAPQSPAAEQFRRLRTNLNFSPLNQGIKSLVIVSASANEGKSWIAANLAAVYAQEGKNVLLVDSDLRKPAVHELFGIKNDIGISNILNKQANLGSVIKQTFVDNLDLLVSGHLPRNPAELLASPAMGSLMDELAENYDLVIYDSPPILLAVDGQILSNKCDSTILVINSGKTGKEEAAKAKEAISLANGKIIGVILNNFATSKKNTYL